MPPTVPINHYCQSTEFTTFSSLLKKSERARAKKARASYHLRNKNLSKTAVLFHYPMLTYSQLKSQPLVLFCEHNRRQRARAQQKTIASQMRARAHALLAQNNAAIDQSLP